MLISKAYDTAKLCDFGLARAMPDPARKEVNPEMTPRIGPPKYRAPEVVKRRGKLYKLISVQLTHSLKAPGFNLEPIKGEAGFKPLLSKVNLYRYKAARLRLELRHIRLRRDVHAARGAAEEAAEAGDGRRRGLDPGPRWGAVQV